jgi:hypothetical protein
MSDQVDPDAGGYPPVEFLDIGPMNSALSDPPLSWAYYHGDIGDVQPTVDSPDGGREDLRGRHEPAT